MNRAQLNSLIEQVVGQITAANFSFLTGKPEYLNAEAGNNRLTFPLAFMSYPTATLRPYTNQVVGPLTRRYTVSMDFLQLVPVDDQNDAGAMRTITETMGLASDEFLARMATISPAVVRIDVDNVRDTVVNPHPASENVLVGVSIVFEVLTADTFNYCEIDPDGDIVIPQIGPQYVYFAGVIEINNDTVSNAILLPGSLNITGISDISNGEEFLYFTVNASEIVSFTVSDSLKEDQSPEFMNVFRIFTDISSNVGSISIAQFVVDPVNFVVTNGPRGSMIGYPSGLGNAEIAYLHFHGIALK